MRRGNVPGKENAVKRKIIAGAVIFITTLSISYAAAGQFIDERLMSETAAELIQKFGDSDKFRMEKGVKQVAQFWSEQDGSKDEYAAFCKQNYIADPELLEEVFQRLELFNEAIYGYFTEMVRDITRPLDLDWGEILPIDMLIGQFNPSAHINEDLFQNRIAFIVLLNFPSYTLDEKARLGPQWTRQQWAYANMGDQFISRIPARIFQNISKVMTRAETYISEYNIYLGNIVNGEKKTYFPKDLKLISHWGLRDELKARYADLEGLKKQSLIYQIMLRIIAQEIPEEMIDRNDHTWDPVSNTLYKDGVEVPFKREPDTRYAILSDNFRAMQTLDPYFPNFPTHMKRSFEIERKLSFEEVEKMFDELCSSKQVRETATVIKKRLGRNLKPWDIWYNGFAGGKSIPEEEISEVVSRKYPTVASFEKDLQNILMRLGFTQEQARYIAPKIQVDPARGAGHSGGSDIRNAKARLRTRVPKDGMDYKGFNIAMHELGHAVEQTLSLYKMDHYSLRGVPNTAFTEAFAFVFQGRDLEMLGVESDGDDASSLKTLDTLWSAYEIMGVSLVDMKVWHWMYEHPSALPAELKEAVISIAKEVWNQYYADLFEVRDLPILAIYSHMFMRALYLPDYPIGHVIQFQIEQYLEGKNLGAEMERMCSIGNIIPQLWMQNAVESKISIAPLLRAADEALAKLKH